MLAWFISDTHGKYIVPPEVDVVFHCGDFTNHPKQIPNEIEWMQFLGWFSKLPIKYKVLVPGNHDVFAYHNIFMFKSQCYDKGIYPLVHDYIELEGRRVFGSPYTPNFNPGIWAFNKARNKLATYWAQIPEVDILLTHGPPKGILDLTEDRNGQNFVQVGCKALRNRVEELEPTIHAFGHIHDEKHVTNFGVFQNNGPTTFINCSVQVNGSDRLNSGIIKEI